MLARIIPSLEFQAWPPYHTKPRAGRPVSGGFQGGRIPAHGFTHYPKSSRLAAKALVGVESTGSPTIEPTLTTGRQNPLLRLPAVGDNAGMDRQRELAPPWIEHPYIPRRSNDWTMGPAGFYLWQWEAWFRALGQSARDDYRSKYPEPEGWTGFYEMKASGRMSGRHQDDEGGFRARPDERERVSRVRE